MLQPVKDYLLLQNPIAVNERELCKYFESGNFVKVVSGIHEGGTGMIVKVDQHMLIILSDTTKEHVRQFLFKSWINF